MNNVESEKIHLGLYEVPGFGAPDISRENRQKNRKNRFMRDPDSRVPAASQTRILIPVLVVPVPKQYRTWYLVQYHLLDTGTGTTGTGMKILV